MARMASGGWERLGNSGQHRARREKAGMIKRMVTDDKNPHPGMDTGRIVGGIPENAKGKEKAIN